MKKIYTCLLTVMMVTCSHVTALHAQELTIDGLRYTIAAGEATVQGYESILASGEVAVRADVNGVPVTAIGAKAFLGCDELTAISLPSSVTTVGDWAFMKCKNFTTINIPAGCTLGMGCFTACPSLDNITLEGGDANNYVIDDEGGKLTKGVLYTKDMKRLVFFIPTNAIDKGGQVVHNTMLPEQWKIPNTVEVIAAGSMGENWLEYVVLPSFLKTIEPYAFYRHKDYSLTPPANWRMTELTIPAFVEDVNLTAFLQETGEVIEGNPVQTRFKNLFFMGQSSLLGKEYIANTLSKADPLTGADIAYGSQPNVYIKESVYETYYVGYDQDTYEPIYELAPYFGFGNIGFKIPIDRLALDKPITMCRDFDMNFYKTKEYTGDQGYGYRPLAYIATKFVENGYWDNWIYDETLGEWVECDEPFWVETNKYYEFCTTWYVPSRTGQNSDEYHGVLVKIDNSNPDYIDMGYIDEMESSGWRGPTLYYTIGEYDYSKRGSTDPYDMPKTEFEGDYENFPTTANHLVGVVCNSHVPVSSDGVNHWGLASDGKWMKFTSSNKLTPYSRAYLKPTPEDNVKMLALIGESSDGKIDSSFNDEHSVVTGIATVESRQPRMHKNVWYTIGGQRLQHKPTAKGIYLCNGKKYIVK